MKIIIDAMGGDNAPDAFLEGAFTAAKQFDVGVILVGRVDQMLSRMKELGYNDLPKGVELSNADDVVDMHDDPANVVHTRKNSSMVLGLRMLAEGQGDAFISAGNTGALLSAATLVVKRIRGIRRAAFCPPIPTKSGTCYIIDAGANVTCTPEFLLQFGCMGSFYAKRTLGLEQPRVGLLNNGTESGKGDELHKQAFELLESAGASGLIQFIGNIEARDVPLGGADVAVCDGFSGNVLLKSIEGTAMFMGSLMKKAFKKNLLTKLGAGLCMSGINEIRSLMDYNRIGGTMLLGLTKPVIKAHGSSGTEAVCSAVRQAVEALESGIYADIQANIDKITLPKEREIHA